MSFAFIDVDGTLLTGPSSESSFVRHLLMLGMLGSPQIAAATIFIGRYSRRFGRHVLKKNKAYLAGLEVERVAALARPFVCDVLRRRLRLALLARIEGHRKNGDVIVLLTGTPDFVAKPLAEIVAADLWFAARCAQADGRFLPEPPVCHPFGVQKLLQVDALCRERAIALSACTAYADAADDAPLLARVGCPVAVHPDPMLAKLAMRSGWEILRSFPDGAPAFDELPRRGRILPIAVRSRRDPVARQAFEPESSGNRRLAAD